MPCAKWMLSTQSACHWVRSQTKIGGSSPPSESNDQTELTTGGVKAPLVHVVAVKAVNTPVGVVGFETFYLPFGVAVKKIVSLFHRNLECDVTGSRRVRDEVMPAALWVANGEGVATRKWDGVAVLIKNGEVFMRYDLKVGRVRPVTFVPAQAEPDRITGHWPGWVTANSPSGKHVMEAVNRARESWPAGIPDGTYEACGPKIGTRHGANPEGLTEHRLYPHGQDVIEDCPRTFDALKAYLQDLPIEGIVWHHPDGRMVKIKKADFPV